MNHKILFLLVVFIASCNQGSSDKSQANNQSNPSSAQSQVIAKFKDGVITTAELKKHILKLPAKDRWSSVDSKGLFIQHVENAMINKALITEAKLIGLDNTFEYKSKQRKILRQAHVSEYLNTLETKRFQEGDLIEFYKNNISDYQLPEKRYVHHIFKSISNPNAEDEISSLRKRVIKGENFKILATKNSDSETRHNEGYLGLVKKGDFPESFDKVVFSLPQNTLSQIIKTKDGFHLFLVTEILSSKTFGFDEIKQKVRQDLLNENEINRLKDHAIALGLPNSESYNIPKQEEIKKKLLERDINSPLLEIGDYKLNISEYFSLLQEYKPQAGVNYEPYQLIEKVAYDEIIYQNRRSHGVELSQNIDGLLSDLIIEEFIRIKFKSYINKHPKIIKEYYKKNQKRFTNPIQLNLRMLLIPIDSSNNLMPELEIAIVDLNNEQIQIEDLAEKYEGKVLSLGFKNHDELKRINPSIVKFAYQIDVNDHAPPFTNNGFYNIIKLLGKTKPEIQPLAIIRDKVVEDYINNNMQLLYTNVTQELINGYEIKEPLLSNFINEFQKLN